MPSTLAPIASLLIGISFLLAGNGLQSTLTPLRASMEQFGALDIGLIGSAYYAGFVAGCVAGPYLILRAGHIRSFAALVSAASAIALVHPLLVNPYVWMICRAVTGFSLAGLYLIIESWLNDRATNENRGLLMSSYIVVNFAAITAGQMLVTLAPVSGFTLFMLASILVSVAAIPVAMTRSAQPAPITLVQFNPKKLYRMAPVGFVGTFMIGIGNGSFWSLGAIYGVDHGLSNSAAALFMSVAVIGGALAQWPVGRMSDKMDRRYVLMMVLAAAAAVCMLLASLTLSNTMLLLFGFLFGITTLPGYSIAAAHAYDRAAPTDYVETAAGLLLANGIGSVIGPFVASVLMKGLGASALFFFIAATQVALLLFTALRIKQRASQTTEEKNDFDLFSTATVGAVLTPEPLEEENPMVQTPVDPGVAVQAEIDAANEAAEKDAAA
ncbi:putative MFS-type transporter YcaD [Hartmannibacter diazotrophicus]|uniref:Putative MFS-type transporter YcaD n=1 Tax=Hartmannibacter diazotrophicus TaxID=1482074 RepID=A0A2C9D3L1_9HYPH|nr:MFS transporter [Hartmannibacter diazotrophicus]SON54748.1 putative MFS-type transporter YcaD [Hartmannibacter diazotrophicus]